MYKNEGFLRQYKQYFRFSASFNFSPIIGEKLRKRIYKHGVICIIKTVRCDMSIAFFIVLFSFFQIQCALCVHNSSFHSKLYKSQTSHGFAVMRSASRSDVGEINYQSNIVIDVINLLSLLKITGFESCSEIIDFFFIIYIS